MKSSRIASIAIVAIVATLMLGCADSKTEHVLALADSLMDEHPDSIYQVLDSVCRHNDKAPKSTRMRAELLRAKAQNKAYVDFTTDSMMLEVADYYDNHGSANDRMLAHYLLGCTYRDLKEAPMSLQCYYDAVEAADTTSSDCDYRTMMNIWGQIAIVLEKQCMPLEELEALDKYQKYAQLCCDTFNYIMGVQHRISPYCLMGDTANILKATEVSRQMYLKHGYTQQAARALTRLIYVWLNRHDYAKVHQLQHIYETQSGLFDKYGNIAKGKEHYYYGKGMYYEGIGKSDSALYFYRKLFNAGHTFDACNGLTRIYAKFGNIDSVSHYSLLKDTVFDEIQTNLYNEEMHQVKGMYDYSRNQKIAYQKEQEALRGNVIFAIFIFVVLALAIASYLVHRSFKKKKLSEIALLNDSYISTARLYKKVLNEQELLKRDYELHQKTKEQELRLLNEQLTELQTQYNAMTSETKIAAFHTSNIVKSFHHFSPMDKEHPNDKDWEELDLILSQCVPSFYSMIKHSCLNINEQHVCMLISIGCSSKDASNLLHTQQQHISNIKSNANSKLFNDKSARTLEENLIAAMKNA